MKYEEMYYGHRILVTTAKNAGGRWTSRVEALDTPLAVTDPDGDSAEFSSEEDARRAALSRGASLLDRARQGQGKP